MKKIVLLVVCILVTHAVAMRTFAGAPPGDSEPRLAFDLENNLYLLIFTRNATEFSLHGQLLNPDATPSGGELNPSSAINTHNPDVAYDSLFQDHLVVWSVWDTDADIYGQLVGSDGAMIGDNFIISDATDSQDCPALAFDSVNGRFLAVWNDRRSGTNYIYGQLVNADGTLEGTNIVVYDAAAVDAVYCPAVAYDETNQRFLVTWADFNGAIAMDILGQLVNADGSLSGTSFIISGAANNQLKPSVVYNGMDKQYFVVWEDKRDGVADIYSQIIGADGTLSGSNIPIKADANNKYAPSIAYGSDANTYLVVWAREQTPTEFYVDAQYLKADGTPEGSVFQPSSDQNSGSVKPVLAYNSLCTNYLLSHVTDSATTELRYVVIGDPCETTPPTVTSTTPTAGAVDVAVDSVITAVFDEAMRASTLNANTFSLSESENVDGTVTYDAETRTATFTPAAALASSTTYTATITTGVKDVVGNNMSGEVAWSFTTAQEPGGGGGGGCSLMRR